MLRIGEFSRLCEVTVKTLHHYDNIGLLRPALTAPQTNHRFYSVDQLPRLHRIIALKELGLSLDQIGIMLNDAVDEQHIQGMLRLKQAEIEQRLHEEQARLRQVEFRLRMIEAEHNLPDIEIVVKSIEPFLALTLRRTYTTAESFQFAGDQLKVIVQEAGVRNVGSPLEIHYGSEFTFENLDVELAGPVDETWTESVPAGEYGTFRIREMCAMKQAATHIHQGSFAHLPDKIALVRRWTVVNGFRLCDEMRIIHHRGPLHYLDENNLLEIQHKIAKTNTTEIGG